MILAMTGKGGVGKTTLSALHPELAGRARRTPVLAVDADSNANLNEALGVSYNATVGGIRESARKEAHALKGISKQEFLDLRVQEALVEQKGYDLIVMGRPEGQGCYCFANNVLRDVLRRLARNYRHIVHRQRGGTGAYLPPHAALGRLSADRLRLHGARHSHRRPHLRAGR